MWVDLFTTQRGNICARFGFRAANVQACVAGRTLVRLLQKHPAAATTLGIVLPLAIQLYMASRKPRIKDATGKDPTTE